jgi:hypothetical protein
MSATSNATIEVILPADVVQRLDEQCINSDCTTTVEKLIVEGAELLTAEARAPLDMRQRLAMAWGDTLFHWTRLVDARYSLTALAHEVWELDEQVHGVRQSAPPLHLPRLEPRVTVAVPATPEVITAREEATSDDSAAADLREQLCYGLGAANASAVADNDVPFRINQLNSVLSAHKYELSIAFKSTQVLEFRRAALQSMLEGQRRRADLMRSRGANTDP